MVVGVDNGLDGGLCAVSKFGKSVIAYMPMPTMQRNSKREVDTKAVHEWLQDFNTPFVFAIEEPLKHARSSQAMRSMAISFGKLLGMCESHNYEVACIDVHKWQRKLLGLLPKGKTKSAALALAKKMEPDEDWLANKRCRTPHDGIVDAFLIANYYLQHENNH